MRVSKITIGRLYNLGNYEHVRYELTVEVGGNELAATAFIGLENIMAGLNPNRPTGVPEGEETLVNAEARIAEHEAMSDADFKQRYGEARKKDELLKEWREKLVKAKQKLAEWERVRKRARALLNDIGGAETFTDAKRNWDNDWSTDDW